MLLAGPRKMGAKNTNQNFITSESSSSLLTVAKSQQNPKYNEICITKGLTLLLPTRNPIKNPEVKNFVDSRLSLLEFEKGLEAIFGSSSKQISRQPTETENPQTSLPQFSLGQVLPNPINNSGVSNDIKDQNPFSNQSFAWTDDFSLSYVVGSTTKDCSNNTIASSFRVPDIHLSNHQQNPSPNGYQSKSENLVGGMMIGEDDRPSTGQQPLPHQNLHSQRLNVGSPEPSDPIGKSPVEIPIIMKSAPPPRARPASSSRITRSLNSWGPIRTKDMATLMRHYGQWSPGYHGVSSYSGLSRSSRSYCISNVAPYCSQPYHRPSRDSTESPYNDSISRSMTSQAMLPATRSGINMRDNSMRAETARIGQQQEQENTHKTLVGAHQSHENFGNIYTAAAPTQVNQYFTASLAPERSMHSSFEYGSQQPMQGGMLPPHHQTPTNVGSVSFETTGNNSTRNGITAADQRSKNLALIQEKKTEIIDVEEYEMKRLGHAIEKIEPNKMDIETLDTKMTPMETAENSDSVDLEFVDWLEHHLMPIDRFGFDI